MNPTWARLLVVHGLQLPALGLWWVGTPPWAQILAALWGSAVCCLGTDSGWRWWNRLLITEAVVWLAFGMPW